ncbi:MAG: hypothetical protein JWM21_2848 [Acidobacteria bacterium]|nr:hypothetical protein [Acidobacteriota bacterium]
MQTFWIGFGIPFVVALLFPFSVEFCLPRSTKPTRWIQNCPPFSVYMLAAFPIAMGIFTATIFNLKEINDINGFAVKTYGSVWALYASITALLFLFGLASKAVLHDFTSRPVGPYILRGARAVEAFDKEKKLRDAAKIIGVRSRHDRTSRRKRARESKPPSPSPEINARAEYQKLVQLKSLGEIFKHGNLVAAAYLTVAWVGTVGCVFYFWYVAVLVLSNQTLPVGTVTKLLMVFILLITWFPMRVYMDWYQNYFHNPAWLKNSDGLIMGICLALAGLVFVLFISKPEAIAIICAVVNALVLLFVGVAGRFKPHWLRAVAESLQSLPFFYFFAVYFVFLCVTVAIGVRILKT